jgi:hypothetical protein
MLENQDEKVRERYGKLSHNHSFKIMNVIFFWFVRLYGVTAAVKICCLVGCKKVKVHRNRLEISEGGDRSIALHSLDLCATTGWLVSTTPWPLYPREKPGTHCTGGRMGPRASLDVYEKSTDRSDRSQSLYRLSYPGSLIECGVIKICQRFGVTCCFYL